MYQSNGKLPGVIFVPEILSQQGILLIKVSSLQSLKQTIWEARAGRWFKAVVSRVGPSNLFVTLTS